jgi:hypothetical protein
MLYCSSHERVSTALGQWTTSVTPPTQGLCHRPDMGEGACDQGVSDAPTALPPPFPPLYASMPPLGRDASGMGVLPSSRRGGDACACAIPW